MSALMPDCQSRCNQRPCRHRGIHQYNARHLLWIVWQIVRSHQAKQKTSLMLCCWLQDVDIRRAIEPASLAMWTLPYSIFQEIPVDSKRFKWIEMQIIWMRFSSWSTCLRLPLAASSLIALSLSRIQGGSPIAILREKNAKKSQMFGWNLRIAGQRQQAAEEHYCPRFRHQWVKGLRFQCINTTDLLKLLKGAAGAVLKSSKTKSCENLCNCRWNLHDHHLSAKWSYYNQTIYTIAKLYVHLCQKGWTKNEKAAWAGQYIVLVSFLCETHPFRSLLHVRRSFRLGATQAGCRKSFAWLRASKLSWSSSGSSHLHTCEHQEIATGRYSKVLGIQKATQIQTSRSYFQQRASSEHRKYHRTKLEKVRFKTTILQSYNPR